MAGTHLPGTGTPRSLPARRPKLTTLDTWVSRGLMGIVQFYQHLVSPLFPPSCRYSPSCSCYAREALRKHGVWRGGRLAVSRLARCHPFSAGGWDPVP
ncbi:MAG: membrane protein insertion efficiency factor YidD [Candidatus Eisenbacteria sp.]|nr:membrane protein insertion efficiency factor YidD [Candidatus Eisenbacteria bacterium]